MTGPEADTPRTLYTAADQQRADQLAQVHRVASASNGCFSMQLMGCFGIPLVAIAVVLIIAFIAASLGGGSK